jgi:chaperonin GroES
LSDLALQQPEPKEARPMMKPTCDRVLVALDAPPEKTEGGILVPTRALDNQRIVRGVVRARGDGRMTEGGEWEPMFLKEGDTVYFDKALASQIIFEGETLYVLRQTETLVYSRG